MMTNVNEKIRELYAKNFSFNEFDAKKNQEEFYNDVIKEFGTWQKGLKAHGINKKVLKEREKFHIYFIMKNRYEKYGEMALRPKNIDPLIKDRITETYKTIKNLKIMLDTWNEEKTLFEVRKKILTGNQFEDLFDEDGDLTRNIKEMFKNPFNLEKEYNNKFGLRKQNKYLESAAAEAVVDSEEVPYVETDEKNKESKQKNNKKVVNLEEERGKKEKSSSNIDKDESLIDLLIKVGLITKKEVELAKKVEKENKEDAMFDCMQAIVEMKKSETEITEENFKNKSLKLYMQMKYYFGDLKKLMKEFN